MELTLRSQRLIVRANLFTALSFFLLSFIFCVVYAQSPLYTSNQEQYFLHGLSRAGFGFLNKDWLANTLDPTPVFSILVYLTYRIFRSEVLFYAYYGLLLGIYLYSLVGIAKKVFQLNGATALSAYIASLLFIHSAALRFALSRVLGPEWTYVFEGGVANQRVLGAVLQPSCFGVFMVLAIYLFLEKRVYPALLALAVAVAFHPTYLLSAALLTLAFMWVTYREEKNTRKSISVGLVAFLLVLPILVYVYAGFGSTSPETTTRAREILVNFRIPHHAVISEWFNLTTVLQVGFILAGAYVSRSTPLLPIIITGFVIALALAALQLATKSAALALVFPWRISVILVPVSVSMLLARGVLGLVGVFERVSVEARNRIPLLSAAIVLILMLVGSVRFILDLERQASAEARPVMTFVARTKAPLDVYLVPIKMQDFRIASGAPIFVDFKSIPYQEAEVLEWYRRIQRAEGFYEAKEPDCSLLQHFSAAEGVSHVVLERDFKLRECDFMQELYRDEVYAVYRLEEP